MATQLEVFTAKLRDAVASARRCGYAGDPGAVSFVAGFISAEYPTLDEVLQDLAYLINAEKKEK